MANELTWHDVLAEEKQQPYFLNTLQTVASERQSGVTIYPPQKDVFNAFRFTELGDVKVAIHAGYQLSWQGIEKEAWNQANQNGAMGDLTALQMIFSKVVSEAGESE